jgi:hypothetical protein
VASATLRRCTSSSALDEETVAMTGGRCAVGAAILSVALRRPLRRMVAGQCLVGGCTVPQ